MHNISNSSFVFILILGCKEPESVEEKQVNQSPTITAVDITPNTGIYNDVELSCTAQAEDPDGDSLNLTYTWSSEYNDNLSNASVLQLDSSYPPQSSLTCTVTASDGDLISLRNAVVRIENRSPVLSEATIYSNELHTDSLLSCSASSEDPDQEDVSLSYMWTIDGVSVDGSVTEDGSELELSPQIIAPHSTVSCLVEATDPNGLSVTTMDSVTIGNYPPAAENISITPEYPNSQDTLLCSVEQTSDADLETVGITYTWSIDGVTNLETSNTLSGPFVVGAEIICTATPADATESGPTIEQSVVVQNTPPQLTSVEISTNGNFEVSNLLTCSASGADFDNEPLTISYEWTNEAGVVLDTSANFVLNPNMVSPNENIFCTATATDPNGGQNSSSAFVSVENTPPQLTDVSITPNTNIFTGTALTCTGTAEDINDGDISNNIDILWSNQLGETISSVSALTLTSENSTPGEVITCTATVLDAQGAQATSSSFVFLENTPPSVASISMEPENPTSQDSISCIASGTQDIDDDLVDLIYTWSIDGVLQQESSTSLSGPFAVDSEIACTATPFDGQAAGNSLSQSVTVINTPPTIDSISIESILPITTSSILICSSESSDMDNESLTVEYIWTNAEGDVLGTDSELALTPQNTHPLDTLSCTVEIADTSGAAAELSTSIEVENTVPVIETVVISQETAVHGSELTCEVTGSDPDELPLSESLVWVNNGTPFDSGPSTTLNEAVEGDLILCEATVTDEHGASASYADSILVGNTAPTVGTPSLSETELTASSSSISCNSPAGEDVDNNDVILITSWQINGAEQAETSSTFLGPFRAGDELTCTVTPDDGIDTGTPASASITISNTDPTVSSISLSPSTAYTNTPLVADYTATDIDSEQELSVTYLWAVNGEIIEEATQETLDSVYFEADDLIYFEIIIEDEMDGADSAYLETTIQNSPPSAPVIEITSSGDFTLSQDDLICSVVSGSDPDDDELEFSYLWTAPDGSTIEGASNTTNLSDTLLATDVTQHGEWTCTVQANDELAISESTQAAFIEPPCNSLTFTDPSGSMEVQSTGMGVGTEDWTVEFWLKVHNDFEFDSGQIFMQNEDGSTHAFRAGYNPDGRIQCNTYNTTGDSYMNVYSSSINDGRWHHIACSFQEGTITIFTDGIAGETDSNTPDLQANGTMSIGNPNGYDKDPPPITLGPIRFSSVTRYNADFSPQTNWLVDEQTIAQYLVESTFNGTTLLDEAGGDNTGTTRTGIVSEQTCPSEDLDEDGVQAFEDCDDLQEDYSDLCPPSGCTEHSLNESEYMICASTSTSYLEAEAICVEHGMHLWTIESQEEEENLEALITAQFDGHLWIGIHDMDGDGTFEWLSEENPEYTNWHSGHDVSGICGQMLSPSQSHYSWSGLISDGDCLMSSDTMMDGSLGNGGYVCEAE
ncbi:MAG: hypothetical protein CMK59_00195 [Proteobacteria bacterium]|nr:hypothetical protein [Pseudomonadota bacterium]